MGAIPPDKSWDEIDREAIEEARARRATGAGEPTFPADRVHQLLLDLQRRFTEAGGADPVITDELLATLRREVAG